MPLRGTRLRIEDMLLTIDRIESYTAGMTFEAFCADPKDLATVWKTILRDLPVLKSNPRRLMEKLGP